MWVWILYESLTQCCAAACVREACLMLTLSSGPCSVRACPFLHRGLLFCDTDRCLHGPPVDSTTEIPEKVHVTCTPEWYYSHKIISLYFFYSKAICQFQGRSYFEGERSTGYSSSGVCVLYECQVSGCQVPTCCPCAEVLTVNYSARAREAG